MKNNNNVYASISEYESDNIQDYGDLLNEHKLLTIAIKSKMNSRKTVNLCKTLVKHRHISKINSYIERIKNSKDITDNRKEEIINDVLSFMEKTKDITDYKSVGIVSSRKSFAYNIQEVLASPEFGLDFSIYLEDDGYNYKPNFIVQCESLYTSNVHPEFLVLDEITSILVQMTSRFHQENLSINQNKFIQWVKEAKVVLMMDADIDIRAIELIREFRYNIPLHIQINHKKVENIDAIHLNSIEQFGHVLQSKVKDNKKIMIVSGSRKETRTFVSILKSCGLEQKEGSLGGYLLITIRQGEDDIQKVSRNVNKEFVKYQVVIFTSIFTNGIDFNVPHFDIVMCYGLPKSNCVREMFQMMGRSRIIKDNQIYYHSHEQEIKVKVITYDEIYNHKNDRLKSAALDMFNQVINLDKYKSILYPYKPYLGKEHVLIDKVNNLTSAQLDNSFFTRLYVMNNLEHKLSQRHFGFIMDKLFEQKGYKITQLPSDTSYGWKTMYRIIRLKAAIKEMEEDIGKFDAHIDLNDMEYDELVRKKKSSRSTAIDKRNTKHEETKRMFVDSGLINGAAFYLLWELQLHKCMFNLKLMLMNDKFEDVAINTIKGMNKTSLTIFKPRVSRILICKQILNDLGIIDIKRYSDYVYDTFQLRDIYNKYSNDGTLEKHMTQFNVVKDEHKQLIIENKKGSFTRFINRIIQKMTGFELKTVKEQTYDQSKPIIKGSQKHRTYSTKYVLVEPIDNYVNIVLNLK